MVVSGTMEGVPPTHLLHEATASINLMDGLALSFQPLEECLSSAVLHWVERCQQPLGENDTLHAFPTQDYGSSQPALRELQSPLIINRFLKYTQEEFVKMHLGSTICCG